MIGRTILFIILISLSSPLAISDSEHGSESFIRLSADRHDLYKSASYLEALGLSLVNSSTPYSYERIHDALAPYFKQNILPFLNGHDLKSLTDGQLQTVYRATYLAAFYSFLIDTKRNTEVGYFAIFQVLERRGIASGDQANDAYSMAIHYSDFMMAAGIARRWSAVDSVMFPANILNDRNSFKSDQLRYYSYSPETQTIAAHSFVLGRGPQIVLVAGCHFATDAIIRISGIPELSSVMLKLGFTITPPERFDVNDLRGEALKFPSFVLHPVGNAGTWWKRGFKTDITPTFYYLLDGKIKSKTQGSHDVISDFCNGLKSIGVSARVCKSI